MHRYESCYKTSIMRTLKDRDSHHIPLTVITAVLVLLIAALAGGGLWILRRMHRQLAHAEATRIVFDQGRLIASHLADQPVVKRAGQENNDWTLFSRQVQALHAVEPGLQYVAVSKNGVTVFHEQTSSLEKPAHEDTPVAPNEPSRDVRMTRKLLRVGRHTIPVVAFATHFTGDDGTTCLVEIALRKETVALQEKAASEAISSMFKVSLVTVIISFGVCVVLVVWMMRREDVREKHRREEEHLAFAGVLANGILHDFRNPMSSVRLDVQMLNKEAAKGETCRTERIQELAGRVRGTVDRMDKVFKEFLFMARPSPEERERVDLASCVKDCLSLLTPRFEQAGITIDVDLGDEPLEVLAYPSAVQRALANIMINAEQVSSAGDSIEIRVSGSGSNAVIDISDNGPGVPVSERSSIFEMFVSSRPGGTGLGLFLAKTAIEKSGGTIQVTDSPTNGATFKISLPLWKPET